MLLDDDALTGGNPGGTGDDDNAANLSGTLGHVYGADGAGTVAYLTTGAPSTGGFTYEAGSGGSLLVKQNGTTVLTLTLNATTGAYTVAQNAAILHAAGNDENNQLFTINYKVTDGDGDTANGTLSINVDDDTPIVNSRSDLIYANNSNKTPGGTGIFSYSVGADQHVGYSASNSDFSAITLSGTVGLSAISGATVVWESESSTQAVFDVDFTYVSNPTTGATTTADGALIFDKTAGTYTFQVDPILSFSVLTTAASTGFTGYLPGSDTTDSTQPVVTVAALASNFFVQFTAFDRNNSTPLSAGTTAPTAYSDGEVFTGVESWASVSGVAAGVAGDTMQRGEVLDLDFFKINPTGHSSLAPTATSSAIFMQFDGLDNGEDMVVILKLVDSTNSANHTTRALIVDYADIYHATNGVIMLNGVATTVPTGFGINGAAIDNNDGVVFIESQDYNASGENWVIEGAQVMASTEGVSGTGINLNGKVGASGASTGTQTFANASEPQNVLTGSEAGTWDGDVFKITNIGFVTNITPDTHLSFTTTVVDADGDATAPQTLDVSISGGSVFTAGTDWEAIQGRTGLADTFVFASVASSPSGASHDVITGYEGGSDKIDVSGIDANSVGGLANDAFAYLGGGAFGNVAGQMRFDAGTHQLQGDVNGDGAADFVVELVAISSLASGDLLL